MEGRRRQDGVDRGDRDRVEQVVHQVLDPLLAEADSSLVDHGRGSVQGDDVAPGEAFEEMFGHLPGPAAGVEHPFVPGEVEPPDDRDPPPGHRDREPVVGACVPVPRHGAS
jgi:hypothetical protein